MMIKKILRIAAASPVGTRLRAWSGVKVPQMYRPWRGADSVSDIFVWRCDGEWRTCFLLSNVSSLNDPASQVCDVVTLLINDQAGVPIVEQKIVLEPGETRSIDIAAHIPPSSTNAVNGTFCIFHDTGSAVGLSGSNISERGYVGYRRVTDTIWAMVHGNINAFAKGGSHPYSIASSAWIKQIYRPQMPFDDCERFEFACPNPSGRSEVLKITFHGTDGMAHVQTVTIPSRGLHLFNPPGFATARVELSSNVAMWRPVVFKFHKTHFDVLHG